MRYESDKQERREHHGYAKGKFLRESEYDENHFMKHKPAHKILKW